MIIKDLLVIATRGAEKPLYFWHDTYKTLSTSIQPKLKKLADSLEDGTATKQHLARLADVLAQESPNEYTLVQELLYVSDILSGDISDEDRPLGQAYIQTGKKFYERAQMAQLFANERDMLKKSLPESEQQAHDRRLFENEGMMYCLEYYLALYKYTQDAQTVADKKLAIESTTINAYDAKIPGLWIDFDKDEVLHKFVLKILDDTIRHQLLTSYYDAKEEIMKVHLHCDRQGTCEATYTDTAMESIIEHFKQLISVFIHAFQHIGIERLSSMFLKPYGDKPLLKDIIL